MRSSPVNAPVHCIPEVLPCSVNVPLIFGAEYNGSNQ
nr:MAG TPA: hypothetical protein [Caudoviricetes sp.]